MFKCPLGCRSPLCVWNDDPPNEDKIMRRTTHYAAERVLDALLQQFEHKHHPSSEDMRLRAIDFYRRVDKLIIESKRLMREGNQDGLVRYGERFRGLFVSWVPLRPLRPSADEALGRAQGLPHVIRVSRVVSKTQTQEREAKPLQGFWISGATVHFDIPHFRKE